MNLFNKAENAHTHLKYSRINCVEKIQGEECGKMFYLTYMHHVVIVLKCINKYPRHLDIKE